MFHVVFCILLLVVCVWAVMGRFPWLGRGGGWFVCCCLLVVVWFLFGEVSSSSGMFPLPLGAWDRLRYLIVDTP